MDLLVVERDPLVRETAIEILQDAGFKVSSAACAETALEIAAAKGPPAVLVADLSLRQGSGLDGANLATIIRRRQPRASILYTVGDAECVPEQRLQAHERCLAKPFSSTKLMHAIRDLIAKYEISAGPAQGRSAYSSDSLLPAAPAPVMGLKPAYVGVQLEPL